MRHLSAVIISPIELSNTENTLLTAMCSHPHAKPPTRTPPRLDSWLPIASVVFVWTVCVINFCRSLVLTIQSSQVVDWTDITLSVAGASFAALGFLLALAQWALAKEQVSKCEAEKWIILLAIQMLLISSSP